MTVRTTLSVQLTRKTDKNVYVEVQNEDGEATNTVEIHPNQIQQLHIAPGEVLSVYVDDAPHQELTEEGDQERTSAESRAADAEEQREQREQQKKDQERKEQQKKEQEKNNQRGQRK